MNYEAAIALARQRMREIGKTPEQYHIDVLSITGTPEERANGEITYKSYNEYLYLLDYFHYSGLIIFSDSAIFHADDYTYNTKLQEFTGEIKIFKLPDVEWTLDGGTIWGVKKAIVPIDFLRVVIH